MMTSPRKTRTEFGRQQQLLLQVQALVVQEQEVQEGQVELREAAREVRNRVQT